MSFKPTQASPGMCAATKSHNRYKNLAATYVSPPPACDHLILLLLTGQETQFFLLLEADQMTPLAHTVSLSVVPALCVLVLEMIAEVLEQQVPTVTVAS